MNKYRKTYFLLTCAVVFMFFFSYMLVPLYDIFCEVTGLNGKTNISKAIVLNETPKNRFVKIQFTSNVVESAPFQFKPLEKEMIVEVGKIYNTSYLLTNKSTEIKHVTASPSVVPSQNAEYFKKIECFCFTEQKILGLTTESLPLQFIIDNKLPLETNTLILSYTLFNTTNQAGLK